MCHSATLPNSNLPKYDPCDMQSITTKVSCFATHLHAAASVLLHLLPAAAAFH
jgi:hypothetical protein